MAVLNDWQRIDRVLKGRPFGDGSDGAYSSATVFSQTTRSCSGSSGQANLTIASGAFSNGDIVAIHQSRGTGAGQWEINRIGSGGGTTTLTMQENLHYTYTDSGDSQAQVTKIPMYSEVTIQSGTWSPTDWGGDTGGLIVICGRTSVTVTGTVELNGGNGSNVLTSNNTGGGSGGGFRGGNVSIGSTTGYSGEGNTGASANTEAANGSGGGAGQAGSNSDGSGGGGANGANGSNATTGDGAGGTAAGSADLTTMVFGGGGGGGSQDNTGGDGAGGGGAGGGIIVIISKNISGSGTVRATGGTGGISQAGGAFNSSGGGGAGGSCLFVGQSIDLSSMTVTFTGGAGGNGSGNNDGGAGSTGRVAAHYSGSVSGTTSPSATTVLNSDLVEVDIGSYAYFM